MGRAPDRSADVAARLGLDLPPEWWPAAGILEAIEGSGFRWLQVSAPPVQTLADSRHSVRHSKALAVALTNARRLNVVVHASPGLRLGDPLGDRAFEGLLDYASQIGARHVVYHALDVPRRGRESAAEELSLRRLAGWAEASGIAICLENLCPVYPGASHVCHDPLSIRDLVARIGSTHLGMAFDVGHANVVAGLMGTELLALIEPVLPHVRMFHLHDNLGARLSGGTVEGVDPVRLDLHLPPGDGEIRWGRVADLIGDVEAPLLLEVDPSVRRAPAELYAGTLGALAPITRALAHAA